MVLQIYPGDRIKVTARIVNTGLAYTYKFGCSIGMSTSITTDAGSWYPKTTTPGVNDIKYDDGLGQYIDVPLATGQQADVSRIFKIPTTVLMSQFAEILDTYVTVKDQALLMLGMDIDTNVMQPIFPGATITFVKVERVV